MCHRVLFTSTVVLFLNVLGPFSTALMQWKPSGVFQGLFDRIYFIVQRNVSFCVDDSLEAALTLSHRAGILNCHLISLKSYLDLNDMRSGFWLPSGGDTANCSSAANNTLYSNTRPCRAQY